MVTTTSFGTTAAVLETRDDDAVREVFRSRIKQVIGPLMTAENPRQFRRRLEKAVVDYTPIKMWIAAAIAANATHTGDTGESVTKRVNEAVWEVLDTRVQEELAAQAKLVLLDILNINTELGRLFGEMSEGKKAAITAVILDAHWVLQRLVVIQDTLLLIRNGELKPENKAMLHWLCLSAKQSIKEWQSMVFGHSPVLQTRLQQPRNVLSDEEMGKRLGLPA